MRTDSVTAPSAFAAPPTPADKPVASTAAAVAGYSASRTLDLTVKTREGDTVTISSSQTTTVGAAGWSAGAGEAAKADAVVKTTSSSLSVSVDGDLSKDELADLKKVLKALGQA